AAHAVFLRHGTTGTRTQDIADAAGVNKALLHYYFGTKQALADAVFAREAQAFFPRIARIMGDETMAIGEKVHAFVREQIDFHTGRPYLAPYLAAELHADPSRLSAVLRRSGPPPIDVLDRQLAAAARRGEIRPITARHFMLHLMGMVVLPFVLRPAVCTMLALDTDAFERVIEERRRRVPEFFLAGLRP
ncbi:MAG: TetR/AcrR family transcriptional regulator, partial [Gemmatimonadaceae bacterium]|nr:TetR/AcrR family transcriptional regulator [Gemmatimonadaceae bacterium]